MKNPWRVFENTKWKTLFWFYVKRESIFKYYFYLYVWISICRVHSDPLVDKESEEFNTNYWKRYNSMNNPFELKIDFKNDWNWISAFFVKFKIRRHIWLHRRHSKNLKNLQLKSLFSKRYIISKEVVMKNYKCYFKKHFLSFAKHNYRAHVWQDTEYLRSELSFL